MAEDTEPDREVVKELKSINQRVGCLLYFFVALAVISIIVAMANS